MTVPTAPKIIVTRPEPAAARFATLVSAAGYDPIISPVMRIIFTPKQIDFGSVSGLAFTSVNGVRAFAALDRPSLLPVFAVGPVTAQAAFDAGHTSVKTASGDVASLAGLIRREWPGAGAVLHITGSSRAGDLVAALQEASVKARSVSLYDAEPARDVSAAAASYLKTTPENGWAVFFSPRSAQLFIDQAKRAGVLQNLTGIHAACLSAVVAAEADKTGWKSINVSSAPTNEALLAMIAERNKRGCL